METKKISRTVQRRLNKKARLESSSSAKTNLLENIPRTQTATVPKKQSKQKKKVVKIETKATVPLTVTKESKAESQPTTTTISKRKRNPENKVVYINSNYGSGDPNSVGGLIQAELVELRNQSENIKTASDLTESQAHVVKRQITRLQGSEKERVFKRPKHYSKTLGEATKELKQIMEKQKAKHVKSTSG